jgi:hypothetical protein
MNKSIPKICHLYWGRYPMSLLQVFTVMSFHKYNPDWKIQVNLSKQSPEEIGSNNWVKDYTGFDYFYKIRELDYVEIKEIDLLELGFGLDKHPILISDLMRFNTLYERGGVYSDFDVIWLKPISEFKNIECLGNPEDFECTVCFSVYTYGFHNVANMIAEKESPYLLSLIEKQKTILPPYSHMAFSTYMMSDMYPDLDSVTKTYPRILALQYKTFYPYSTHDLGPLYLQNDLSYIESKDVMCVHWFNGNKYSQDYISDFGRNCSMTTILKREGYI